MPGNRRGRQEGGGKKLRGDGFLQEVKEARQGGVIGDSQVCHLVGRAGNFFKRQ